MRIKRQKRPSMSRLVSVKFTPEDYACMSEKALLYTGGNISEWIRYASINLLPKSKDLIDEQGHTDTLPGEDDLSA